MFKVILTLAKLLAVYINNKLFARLHTNMRVTYKI